MPFWNRGSNGRASGNTAGRPSFANRAYPYNLRWVLFFTALIGIIWALAMGVQQFQNRTTNNRATKLQVLDIVTGVLYLVIAAVEFYALITAALHNAKLGRLLFVVAPIGVAVSIGTQVLMVILHFSLKGDKINQCIDNYTTMPSISIDGKLSVATEEQATQWCNDSWNRGTWGVFAWLVMVVLVALLFASMAIQYARQLADPSIVRTRVNTNMGMFNNNNNQNQNQNQAYPMQPQGGFYPPPPLQHQDSNSWMVPPYPGPREDGQGPQGYDKADYHPEAEWAQHQSQYNNQNPFSDLPPPPAGSGSGIGGNREEEEAWARARDNGVTAHLTGQASPPPSGAQRVRDETNTQGFVVPNSEEDEAWERARMEGPTAHLTGNGLGSGRKGGDNAV